MGRIAIKTGKQNPKAGSVARKTGINLYKTVMIIIGFALAIYVITEFRLWSMAWTDVFIRLWRLEEIIFVSLVVVGVTIVITWLLKWFIRLEVGK